MTKDPFSRSERSRVMQAVGQVDTEPELRLRKELWRRGCRYRVNERICDTRPDIAFLGPEVAVFVDGCFWHGCPRHYIAPDNNASFWKSKLEGNQNRDAQDTQRLEDHGWAVLRFWACEIHENLDAVADTVEGTMR